MIDKTIHINRLVNEKSPYLQQHARNPVDWYPWGEEAFEKARRENKMIFLSIGYSSCHWCHVMARESFEDEEIGRMLNSAFVNIKVDREERPDVDQLYMTICQMLTGHGGWPLTVFMTPERKPFYVGTYYPRESRYGRIGLVDLIPRITWAWEEHRDDILNTSEAVIESIRETFDETGDEVELGEIDLKMTYQHLQERYDDEYGGFGGAPKFPMPHNLMFLFRYWRRYGEPRALDMAVKTLRKMRYGGIFDQLGHGFHRYSTDEQWLVPHFEKMLYDQALMSLAYIEGYQATMDPDFRRTTEEIFRFVFQDLRSREGGFYSALDADSEGEEGKYYLWTLKEFRDALQGEDVNLLQQIYDVREEGNFTEETSIRPSGRNILHLRRSPEELAREMSITLPDLEALIRAATRKLKSYRDNRIPLGRDGKILTDWNSLMIGALARGGSAFDRQDYISEAVRSARYLLSIMRPVPGKLYHSQRDSSPVPGMLDDYAFLGFGLIELYEATFDPLYLSTAIELTDEMLDLFSDGDRGMLYMTDGTSDQLPVKTREIYDGALPSGNSMVMLNLAKLGRITGRSDFTRRADDLARSVSVRVRQLPTAHTMLMTSLDFLIGPSYRIVVAGESDAPDTMEFVRRVRKNFVPSAVVVLRPSEDEHPVIDKLSDSVSKYDVIDGEAAAYVCGETGCLAPVRDPEKLEGILIASD